MPASAPPNILLLMVDEQPWCALGAGGSAIARTPAIDQLAKQGCRFTHCFAAHTNVAKSRLAMLTGRSASQHQGCGGSGGQRSALLPQLLLARGYRCGALGAVGVAGAVIESAFDEVNAQADFATYDGYREFLRTRDPDALRRIDEAIAAAGAGDCFALPADCTPNALSAKRTIEFLGKRAGAGQPFLCVTGLRTSTQRAMVPQQFADLYDPVTLSPPAFAAQPMAKTGLTYEQLMARESVYLGSVSELDYQVGGILRELERLHLAENTIVVYTAARGRYVDELLGDSVAIVPDELTRVPLIVRGPAGVVSSDVCCDAIVETVDVAPTLLELAGVSAPTAMRGQSLVPILAGASSKGKEVAITEMPGRRAVRTAHFQYVANLVGRDLLFDLSQPDSRLVDVASQLRYRGTVMEHRHRLLLHMLWLSELDEAG